MNRHPVDVALERAAQDVLPHFTEDLRRHANRAGWPASAVEDLSVAHSGGAFIPRHSRRETHDVEYGTRTTRPNPAMRTWANGSHTKFLDEYDRSLGKHLSGVLV